ncbi:MAG TPA: 50S ribosomal protein L15 [Candidatus Latescibacteria bacterium]|nr:50S ribosomal protein L15 [Candidatus Handelsmanbacteria bacterium]HIL08581.1 50S ribosomal protein L15 [Candidatus Latescibacterota bacterium]
MRIGEIKCPQGSKKNRKRLGQGPGSGTGKTAGKGHKGQRARSGARRGNRIGFTGGTLPLFRHLPKIGFSNQKFKTTYQTVNIQDLETSDVVGDVGPEELAGAGLIKKASGLVKVLGQGELTRNLTVKAHKFSSVAAEKIQKAGGKAEVI